MKRSHPAVLRVVSDIRYRSRRNLATGCALLLMMDSSAWAVDAINISNGVGDTFRARATQIELQWNWPHWVKGPVLFTGYWDMNISQWRNTKKRTGKWKLTEAGVAPVARIQWLGSGWSRLFSPYIELGAGLHWLSSLTPFQDILSTQFEFGDLAGIGVQLGQEGRYAIGQRFEHFSNGGFKTPNHGLNFYWVNFSYHFQGLE